VLLSCPTTSGKLRSARQNISLLTHDRLLDKIAKDIMVCEHKTVRRWDGSIGEYKNHLRKKMSSLGAL
jgi:ATP-binding cassette subfamily F protein 2